MKYAIYLILFWVVMFGFSPIGQRHLFAVEGAETAPLSQAKYINTVWKSNPLKQNLKDSPSVVRLEFYPDSVTFEMVNGSSFETCDLLGGRPYERKASIHRTMTDLP